MRKQCAYEEDLIRKVCEDHVFVNTSDFIIGHRVCRLYGIKAFIEIQRAVAIIHGPPGCAYHLKLHFLFFHGSRRRIFTSNTNEMDIVMGIHKKLRQAVHIAFKRFDPKLVGIFLCCPTSIAGTDIETIGKALEKELDIPIIACDLGGYVSDSDEGYKVVMLSLAKKLMKMPKCKIDRSVNLVGEFFPAESGDIQELSRILTSIGLQLHTVLTGGASVEDIERSPEAALNVVRCSVAGLRTAEYMEENFSVPFIRVPTPFGLQSTKEYVLEVAREFHLSKEAEEVIAKEEKVANSIVDPLKRRLKGKRAAIICGPTKGIGFASALSELGIEPVLLFLHFLSPKSADELSRMIETVGLQPEILVRPGIDQISSKLSETDVDIVLATNLEKFLMYKLGLRYGEDMAYKQPYMGYQGFIRFAQDIYTQFKIRHYGERTTVLGIPL